MPTAPETLTVETPDGARLSVHVEGAGPPLLLISGLGGTAGFWAPCVPHLSKRHRVIRLDQRGIGASTRGEAALGVDLLAADCLAVLDALRITDAHIVGHSTGGAIGQAVCWRDPDRVSSLVLSATWLRPSRYMGALFGARRDLLDSHPAIYATLAALLAHPPEWLEANWQVVEAAQATAPATPEARRIIHERIEVLLGFDGSANSHRIGCPTLILGARDDVVVPWFLQKDLHASLPHARAERLPDGGHFFPVTRISGFCDALLWFLENGA